MAVIGFIFYAAFWPIFYFKFKMNKLQIPISWAQVFFMSIRKTIKDELCEAIELSAKAGLSTSIKQLETHLLAGGDPNNLIELILESRKRGKQITYTQAAAIDLAGENLNSIQYMLD